MFLPETKLTVGRSVGVPVGDRLNGLVQPRARANESSKGRGGHCDRVDFVRLCVERRLGTGW